MTLVWQRGYRERDGHTVEVEEALIERADFEKMEQERSIHCPHCSFDVVAGWTCEAWQRLAEAVDKEETVRTAFAENERMRIQRDGLQVESSERAGRIAALEADLSEWRVGAYADETGHLHRCAKVNDVWSCVKGCVVQERDEAKRKLAERECVEISCPAFTRAAEMWQNLLAEARRERDEQAAKHADCCVDREQVAALEADLAAMRGALERIAAPMHTFPDLASEKRRSIAAAALASSPGAASPESLEPILGFQLGSTIDVPAHVAPAWLATAREVVEAAGRVADAKLLPRGSFEPVVIELRALLARPDVQRWAGR